MKKNFTLSIIVILVVSCNQLLAQPTLQWRRNFGGTGNEVANSIRQTSDGGYIIAGSTTSADGDVTSNHGDADYWIVRLSRTGNIVWQKTYGGSGTDIAKCVQQTTDGGYIVAGISKSNDGDLTGIHGISYSVRYPPVPNDDTLWDSTHISYEPWIVKLDTKGNITWSQCYHKVWTDYGMTSFLNCWVNTIIQTTDGGYLMGGTEEQISEAGGGNNGAITKLASNGDREWIEKIYTVRDENSFENEGPNVVDLVQTPTGYTALVNTPTITWDGLSYVIDEDTFVFYVENSRSVLIKYGGTGNDFGTSIKQTADGDFIIAGYSESTDDDLATAGNHGGNDFWLFKTSSSGTVAWSKCYGGSGEDIATGVQQAADGSYYVSGYSLSSDGDVTDHIASATPTADFWTIKTDPSGTLLWTKSFGGTSDDNAFSLEKTYEGGFIVAGSSASAYKGVPNKGSQDLQVFKFIECSSLLPPVIDDQSFCSSKNPTVACISITKGSVVKWYNVCSGGTPLASATPLVSGAYYATQSTIGCESKRTPVSITLTNNCNIFTRKTAENKTIEEKPASIIAYPNPARDVFNISVKGLPAERITLQVTDPNGKIVLLKNYMPVSGVINARIITSNLPQGLYFIRCLSSDKTIVGKVSVER
jgi:Secretion system C-terminal sorting domain/Ig-like domain CHU_C associated